MVVTTVKSWEMMMMQTRTQRQARNRHQNQNQRLESEKPSSARASQNVRIPCYSVRLLGNHAVRRWTSYGSGVRKRDGGCTENAGGGCRLVVAMGAHLPCARGTEVLFIIDPGVPERTRVGVAFDVTPSH